MNTINIKNSILFLILLASMETAMACGTSVDSASVTTAQRLKGQSLECRYNGIQSSGSLKVQRDQCGDKVSFSVWLNAFDDVSEVTRIITRRGIRKYTYLIEIKSADNFIQCIAK